jgi:serine/threonine-protein kinase
MSENRYSPPQAVVADRQVVPEVPEEVLKKIKNAWVAGAVSSVVTLVMTLRAIAGNSVGGADVWWLTDVALIAGLTFGIYRKSRACAVLMFVYFLISKGVQFAGGNIPVFGVLLAIFFLVFYFQGIQGTFAYRKALAAAQLAA